MVNFVPDALIKFLRENPEDLAALNQLTQQKRDKGEKVEELFMETDYDNDGKLDQFYPDKTILAEYASRIFALPTTSKGELIKGDNYQILKSLGKIDDIAGDKSISLEDEKGNTLKDSDSKNPNKKIILSPNQAVNMDGIVEAKTDLEIENKVNQFLLCINSWIPMNGNELVTLLSELKQQNKLENFLEIIKSKSEGKSLKELIKNKFNQADLERINDVLDGTRSFGNSDKGTYFSNGIQNWFTGLVRGVGTFFTNPSKVVKELKENPSSAIAIGLTLVGAGVAITFPPVGAVMAIGGLGMAIWKFLSNGIKANISEDKIEVANALLDAGSGLIDTVSSVPGTGQSLQQLKFSASVLRRKGVISAARTSGRSVETATSTASQRSLSTNPKREVNTQNIITETQVPVDTAEARINDNSSILQPRSTAELIMDEQTNTPQINQISRTNENIITNESSNKISNASEITGLTDISSIQKGNLGEIRSDITAENLNEVIKAKLIPISSGQIQEKILKAIPEEDHLLALSLMRKASQFGNMRSLNSLVKELEIIAIKSGQSKPIILKLDSCSLGDTLLYLQEKGSLGNLKFSSIDEYMPYFSNQPYILLVDQFVIHKLKTDISFCNSIVKNPNIQLVYPEGWINGINPFRQGSILDIKRNTLSLLEKAKSSNGNSVNLDELSSRVLNESVLSELRDISPILEKRIQIIYNPDASMMLAPTVKNISSFIAYLLEPKSINLDGLEEISNGIKNIIKDRLKNSHNISSSNIEDISNQYVQMYLEMMVRDINVYSPRKLSRISQIHYNKLKKMALEKGFETKDIVFHIPVKNKSYGFTTMAYITANEISPSQIITNADSLSTGGKKLVVVLDDVAGSGSSLSSALYSLSNSGTNYEIIVAPLISTQQAQKYIKNNSKANYYLPGELRDTFFESSFYKSLSLDLQKKMSGLVGSKGFHDNALNLAFPYMVPDNANSLFGQWFAHGFLFNGVGSKASSNWFPSIDLI